MMVPEKEAPMRDYQRELDALRELELGTLRTERDELVRKA